MSPSKMQLAKISLKNLKVKRSRNSQTKSARALTWLKASLFAGILAAQIFSPGIGSTQSDNAQNIPPARKKVGLALGGGGTRGAAHIGVIRVLLEEGVPIDCISGTSIGAIIGGLYAAGLKPDELEQLVCSKKLMHAYETVPIPVRMAVIPIFFIPHMFGYHPYDGLYRGGVFANFIRKSAPPEKREIENFNIPFSAVTTNLLDGKAYAVKTGDIGRAVQASSAIPFLRKPVEMGDRLLVDGGLVVNLPCDQTRELGADFVIAVDIDDDQQVLDKQHFRKIGSSSDRAINIGLSSLDSTQIDKADFLIHPDLSGIKLLDSKPKDALRAIRAGEEMTRKLMPALKQKLKERSITLAEKQTTNIEHQ